VLEPSCGEAAFLLPAAARLNELGADANTGQQLHGVDVHEDSINSARVLLAAEGIAASLATQDFFDFPARGQFDAVIGNPPYVRYQQFAGHQRVKGLASALNQGVRLTQLASSWAAFTVHAAACVKPGGRLGLVLPENCCL